MTSAILPTYARGEISFERGEGPYLFDADGKRYLDFGTGIAVACLGHSHPHLADAIARQAHTLMHVSNLYTIPGQERLAARLTANSFADFVFFCNSGAEANEALIKSARRYHFAHDRPERYRIITFENAFHGRTLATIAATGQAKVLEGFGPKVEGFDHVPVGDIDAVRAAITDETAAVLIEPVQGEGGIIVVPDEFLRELRALCDAHGLLLCMDEVQSGIGRTGKFLAHEWSGIQPDIVSLGKGIGGGFPLGACLLTKEAAVGMVAGTHGSTYGGNPLAMAAGNAVLDVILAEGFLDHVQKMADRLRTGLEAQRQRNVTIVEEIRGRGLMLGFKSRVTNADVTAALREKGLLAIPAGDNVVRLLPPLIVDEEHVDAALDIIERVGGELST